MTMPRNGRMTALKHEYAFGIKSGTSQELLAVGTQLTLRRHMPVQGLAGDTQLLT